MMIATTAGLTRLEVNGLASCGEAEAVCADFWQLAAPEGTPLGSLPDDGGAHGRCVLGHTSVSNRGHC